MRLNRLREPLFFLALLAWKISFASAATAESFLPEEAMTKIRGASTEYVLAQVWSPYCEPCGEEVKELNKALELLNKGTKKLTVVGIPVQSRKREITAFVEHFHPKYEQWISEKSFFRSGSVPLTVLFVGKERAKTKEWRGKVTAGDLVAEIEKISREGKSKF